MLDVDATIELLGERPRETAILFDFDGSLSPIVDRPEDAVPLTAAIDVLRGLVGVMGCVGVVSGRPLYFLLDELPSPASRTPVSTASSSCSTASASRPAGAAVPARHRRGRGSGRRRMVHEGCERRAEGRHQRHVALAAVRGTAGRRERVRRRARRPARADRAARVARPSSCGRRSPSTRAARSTR